MIKAVYIYLTFCYLLLTFGCSSAFHTELRKDLLTHKFPSPIVDNPIRTPVVLKLEEGAPNIITGNGDIYLIIEDLEKNETVEIEGRLFIENRIIHISEVISFDIHFKLKNALIRVGNRKKRITRENVAKIFNERKKSDLEKLFDEHQLKITINKSSKEFSLELFDKKEKDTIKADFFWKNFNQRFFESLPMKTGDKLLYQTKEMLPSEFIKSKKMELGSYLWEEEVKGIKSLLGNSYLSTQMVFRSDFRAYNEKKKEFDEYSCTGGGYYLYEIPSLYSSKFVLTTYIKSKDVNIALGISFDGDLKY